MQKPILEPLRLSAPSRRGLFFIAGPCVIESEGPCLRMAERLARLARRYKVDIIFKASFDKANRTSAKSFRGPGIDRGLAILAKVKQSSGLPVLTDVHESIQVPAAAEIADVLQIPAFLCRQTDLLRAVAQSGRWINIKKGQYLAPQEMRFALEKAGGHAWLTERGTFFGYNRLVVDFTAVIELKKLGQPLVFDATHSVQHPAANTDSSGGDSASIVPLARAAISVGYDGLFFEVHPNPPKALCDGANSLKLDIFERQVPRFLDLYRLIRRNWVP
ncbi:MAG: 3-deoxy-8-phosphooctulonate synthase [Chitinivibrionales bacterium]|nr:3-deoxy-8-phosphooctulonate synthase [Chitinivibrionales bacterium]